MSTAPSAIPVAALPFPDPGDPCRPANPIERLRQHPAASIHATMDPRPKGPVEYVLVHKPASWLLPVRNDKRTRTGAEWQGYFTAFTGDVRNRWIQQPIIAVTEGDAARVVDGETRRQAALLVDPTRPVPVLLYQRELSESELVIAQLQANAQRKDFTPLELAAIYSELLRLNNWSQAQLAKAISVSPAQIAKCLAISKNLCAEVQAMVAAGEVAPRAAYQLSRLSEIPMQIDLGNKVKAELFSVEDLEIHIAKLLGKKVKQSKPMKFTFGGVVVVAKGNVVEGLKAFIAKAGEALKRLERDNLPPEVLVNLLRP
jgi:ParB/RepB/Spo0J family partition protein